MFARSTCENSLSTLLPIRFTLNTWSEAACSTTAHPNFSLIFSAMSACVRSPYAISFVIYSPPMGNVEVATKWFSSNTAIVVAPAPMSTNTVPIAFSSFDNARCPAASDIKINPDTRSLIFLQREANYVWPSSYRSQSSLPLPTGRRSCFADRKFGPFHPLHIGSALRR